MNERPEFVYGVLREKKVTNGKKVSISYEIYRLFYDKKDADDCVEYARVHRNLKYRTMKLLIK